MDAKKHWTCVTPEYITKQFLKYRDLAKTADGKKGLFDHLNPRQRPTFHEIRGLGSREYQNMLQMNGYTPTKAKEYVQALMTHANKKTTEIYLDGGTVTDNHYMPVRAELNLTPAK